MFLVQLRKQEIKTCASSLRARGGRESHKGSGGSGSSTGLKGPHSLCDPCNIKARVPNPRLWPLWRCCIRRTSWVFAGRIRSPLCGSLGEPTQESAKPGNLFWVCMCVFSQPEVTAESWAAHSPTDYCIRSGTSESAAFLKSRTTRKTQLPQHSFTFLIILSEK